MIRYLKILLIALVALWGLIGAFGNVVKLDLAYEQVRAVAAMSHVADAPPWATSNPFVVWCGVALIVGGKLAAFLFCSYGAVAMLRNVKADQEAFQRAKRAGVFGCGLAVASLFAGFMVIGETMFLMFMDPGHTKAAEAAFRYGGFIALIMLYTAQRE